MVLCVLAGMGVTDPTEDNAWALAQTPVLDRLLAEHPHGTLAAAGKAVGRPASSVGTGEAGFRTMAAGRVTTDAFRVADKALRKGRFSLNPALDQVLRVAGYTEGRLHIVTLLTEADVHGSLEHTYAMLEAADFNDVPVVVHAVVDGRDVPRKSATTYLQHLTNVMSTMRKATIGTLSGRAYAMDRDGRWDRTYKAFHAIVRDPTTGSSPQRAQTPLDALRAAYLTDADDEWMPPTRIGDYTGIRGEFSCDFAEAGSKWEWLGDEPGLLAIARPDRVRQLASMLTGVGVPDDVRTEFLTDRGKGVRPFQEGYFATVTRVHGDLLTAFDPEATTETLCETLVAQGIRPALFGESEGAAHLLTFAHDPEAVDLHVVPSPALADRWTDKPAMRSKKVAKKAVEAIGRGEHRFILVDFVAPDAVAHSGDIPSTVRAVEATDAALGEVVEAARARGATVLITSSHGNCEQMITDQGHPHIGHTDHPVPFIAVGPEGPIREGGTLADVAPTVLAALGIDAPAAMTGRPLWRADQDG